VKPFFFSDFVKKNVIVEEIIHGIIKGLWTLLISGMIMVMVNMKLNAK